MKKKQHDGDMLKYLRKMMRIMRLSLFLIIISTAMAFSANSYSQNTKLTLDLENATVKKVLKAIENQSEFLFFYQEKHVDLNRQVTLHATEQNVEAILDQVFEGTDNIYVINDRQIVLGIAPRKELEKQIQRIKGNVKPVIDQPQQKEITGKVTDTEGLPLPGVSVVVKGTTTGTVTNNDGEFSLGISEEADSLQFSFVGMQTQEVAIEDRTTFTVVMEEGTIGLEEVVAVGYGTQKKSDITGSVASLNTEILQERTQTNIVQALQGTVPGVNVTTTSSNAEDNATLLIRGQNSITASNNPLIVLDGITYSGSLSELNPNDIASMEVLKDASSTAIYGSRGANGVILITTKAGKPGKLKVSYNGYYSWDEIAHLPDMQDASEFWEDSWERGVTNPLSMPTNTYTIEQQIDNTFEGGDETDNTDIEAFMMGYPDMTWDEIKTQILSKYPEEAHDYATLKQIAADFAYPAGGRNTDWVDLATRIGHKQTHDVSFSGGNENNKYYISAIYGKTEGLALGDDFQKMIYRINLNLRLTKGVYYGTHTQLGFYDRSGSKANWGGLTGTGAFILSPTYNAYNQDGSIDLHPMDEETHIYNPLEPLLFDRTNKETGLITNHYIDVDIPGISGLHYKLNTGYTWNNNNSRNYEGQNTKKGKIENGILSTYDGNGYSWLVENILSFNKSFNKHNLFLTALYSAQENSSENNRINGKGFANDVMTYYQASKAEILTAVSNYSKRNYISQMFRANYGFDERYLLTATLRRDGYSAFGRTTKFGVFPSVAVGWNIANESFLSPVRNLDVLKLRLSYGEGGNEAVEPYSSLPVLSTQNYIDENGSILYGYFPEALENPDLSWETTKSFNLGLDFTLFEGRIRGVVDTYKSQTFDLLLRETISAINGTTSITRNIGETKNSGFEFQFSTINIDRNKLLWKTDFNFATYNTEIVHVGLKDNEGNYIDDVASEWFIGYPVNVNFDYSLDRILQKEDFMLDSNGEYLLDENNNYILKEDIQDQIVVFGTPFPGKPVVKDVNGDGIIGGSEDKEIHGDLAPDFISGITNTFKYGNWSVSFFFNGVWGITKKNDLINTKGLGPKRKMNLTYWTPDNPINELPGRNSGSMTQQDLYPYFDANYVRLQEVSLMYNFPKDLLSKLSFSDLTAFINIKNLATFTNWNGLDPEYTTQSGVPRAKSYVLGLRFSF